jgi:uncharacterized protein YkwD
MRTPKDGRPPLRPYAAALALACAFGAAAAPAAAAPLSLQVVNARGTAQAALVSGMGTDGDGRLTLDVAPGQVVSVTRGAAAPEGSPGITYSVPSPVPAGPVTVTLPALPGTVAPGLDASERWLFERVNKERAAQGLAAFGLSSTLSRSADAYAHHLQATSQFSHYALADPGVRAVDQGWPVPGGSAVGETLALSPTKELTLEGWRNSPGHWGLLMAGGLDSVGVGRAGSYWVMMPALCQTSAPARCGLGADPAVVPPGSSGSPAATPGRPGGGPSSGRRAGKRRAKLRVALHRRGRRLVVGVRLARGSGRVRVAVRQRGRRAYARRRHRGDLYRFVARLPRRGRWTISVRFDGRGHWRDRRLRPRTIRVR